MISKKISILAIIVIAATLITTSLVTVTGDQQASALTKAQLKAKITALKAKLKALKAKHASTAGLQAQIKKLQAQINDTPTTSGSSSNRDTQVISQHNHASQHSSCTTSNQTISGSCNNTLTQTNTNNGGNAHA